MRIYKPTNFTGGAPLGDVFPKKTSCFFGENGDSPPDLGVPPILERKPTVLRVGPVGLVGLVGRTYVPAKWIFLDIPSKEDPFFSVDGIMMGIH